jgi:DNA-binding transcriptional LysR family regulator
MSVTGEGERFYEQCLAILAQVDSAAFFLTSEREFRGHLRIATPPSFAVAGLGPRLQEFYNKHPGITLDVIVTSAVPDLIRDRIDVAIVLDEEPRSKVAHFLLGKSPRMICASPGYVERFGMPKTPDDLAHHHCVSARFSDLAETWFFVRRGRQRAANIHCKLLSDNGEVLRQACLAGAGIGNFYAFHVQADVKRKSLVRLLTNFEVRPRNMYAIIPHREIIRPQVKAFVEFIRQVAFPRAASLT